ncbi:MAG: cytochrome P450 [Rhizomicrobium sp.]
MPTPPDDRHAKLDALRAAAPVFRDEASKTFVLTRLADARALLSDNTLWKDADRAEEGALVRRFKPADMNRPGDRDSGIGWMDPPDHARVRTPIAQALNRRVAAFRPAMEEIVRRRLDALDGRAAFDIVADFAVPIPIAVIGRLLGVETADLPRFREWSEAAIGVFHPDPSPQMRAATKEASEAISDYLDAAMALRRRDRRDDLIADLLSAQAAGAALSDSEIRVNCMNLMLGGNVTTADLIASAVLLLAQHPGEQARLVADPSLVASAVEEALRFEPPGQGAQRVASRDMAIAGCPVRQGQVVAALLHAANRDPDAFPDPHRFDIGRKDAPHVTFGGGAHLCIGAPLARLEAQTALAGLYARFPGLHLADPAAPPKWRDVPIFRGLETLPVAP